MTAGGDWLTFNDVREALSTGGTDRYQLVRLLIDERILDAEQCPVCGWHITEQSLAEYIASRLPELAAAP